MKLNIAPSSLRPGLGELVPSRYALRVGEIDVLVVSDGVLPLPSNDVGAQRRTGGPGGLAERHVPAAGRFRLGAERGRGPQRRPNHTHRRRAGVRSRLALAAGRAVGPSTGGRRHRSCVRDRRGADPHAHGPRWRAARRRGQGAAASGPADPRGGRRGQVLGVARFLPHLHAAGFPGCASAAAKRFAEEYRGQLRLFEEEHEVAPGVVVHRTGGHTPGHSVVRLASGGDRLTFAGDAVFAVGFEQPDWHNGFEHDPEEAARVRVGLLRELAATGEPLVATHLSFPSVGRVAVAGDVFRWAPAFWDY